MQPADTARAYYTGKLRRHGATARGVDWSSAASQYLRFAQLVKVCDLRRPFSLNDFGCGYGALLEYFDFRHPDLTVRYHGIDISPEMIEAARAKWAHKPAATFSVGAQCPDIADYSVASGVFNVKLDWPVAPWEAYVRSILADLRAKSRRGFAVNFMLPLDDEPSAEQALYRTLPEPWTGFLASELGCAADTLADYGQREFTLLARIA